MKPFQKIAILGGTGKSGKYLVQHLLNEGYQLKLLLRNPENFTLQSPLIELVAGDARNYESIKSLVNGCQAVISTLGQPKGEPSIFSDATRNVIRAMADFRIDRYIITTGLNVDAPNDQKGERTKAGTDWMKIHYPMTTADKQVEYELLSTSTINWTLVRLPMIEQTDERRPTLVSLVDCPRGSISATDLAYFLAESLSDPNYFKKAPFIANQ
ncbi:SDR family oxidoreductase [Algoriphagus jejuensis]|uniref:SDR family oxidoreductase n=1 Tax=Algoriphagus jejuensis TaxID=419934 RepID=A0ABP3YG95_9BACT